MKLILRDVAAYFAEPMELSQPMPTDVAVVELSGEGNQGRLALQQDLDDEEIDLNDDESLRGEITTVQTGFPTCVLSATASSSSSSSSSSKTAAPESASFRKCSNSLCENGAQCICIHGNIICGPCRELQPSSCSHVDVSTIGGEPKSITLADIILLAQTNPDVAKILGKYKDLTYWQDGEHFNLKIVPMLRDRAERKNRNNNYIKSGGGASMDEAANDKVGNWVTSNLVFGSLYFNSNTYVMIIIDFRAESYIP